MPKTGWSWPSNHCNSGDTKGYFCCCSSTISTICTICRTFSCCMAGFLHFFCRWGNILIWTVVVLGCSFSLCMCFPPLVLNCKGDRKCHLGHQRCWAGFACVTSLSLIVRSFLFSQSVLVGLSLFFVIGINSGLSSTLIFCWADGAIWGRRSRTRSAA